MIPPARLARDRAGIVVLTLLTTGIPARAWTILTMPDASTYAAFPVWAQCAVLSAYTCQLAAEAWGGSRARMIAAVVSAMTAGAAAWLFLSGNPESGGAATWASQAVLQIWAFGSYSRYVRLEAHFVRST